MLQLENIHKHFAGLAALAAVSLEVNAGEVVGMIGPNGSGKSTLFNIITGFYRPSRGHVFLRGELLDDRSVQEIVRMGVARTFQNPRLFPSLSVGENVKVALRHRFGQISARHFFAQVPRPRAAYDVEDILRQVGLWNERAASPANLSYGHCKRLELARSLARKPELLLLDEPTAGLNTEETVAFGQILRELATSNNLTLIIIEHDIDFIRRLCSRVLVLNNGRLICDDKPEKVVRNQEVIEAYLGKEAHVEG